MNLNLNKKKNFRLSELFKSIIDERSFSRNKFE